MSDDRPVEDPVDQVGRIQAELDDFKATMIARLSRKATGDVEPTIRTTAKDNTLILNGAQVSRETYGALWTWAQEQGLVITGLFTTGNGSTTFGLPDFRGRVPIGVGTLGSDSYALGALGGAATRVISTANLPAHDHNVSGTASSSGSHGHSGSTDGSGSHSGHNSGSFAASNGAGSGFSVANTTQNSNGSHSHGININDAGSHTHSLNINESTVGSGTAFDVRQPSIAINWLIWT